MKKADSGKPENPSGSHNNSGNAGNAYKGSAPRTGDNTDILLPAVTGGIALILIAAAVVAMRRKKRR